MMDSRPIGIFDSGLGGLTALKELRRLLPQENLIYFGDTGRAFHMVRAAPNPAPVCHGKHPLSAKLRCKMIIAACGTISSIMTDEMAGGMGIPLPA